MPPRLTMAGRVALTIAAGATLAAATHAADLVFANARVIPIDGPEIDRGYVTVTDGTIEAVGRGAYPGSADEVIDCDGKVVMPGLICTHSHVGGIGGADSSGPIQPGVRVRDSINVRDPGFRRALAGGLTSLNIMPGSGHLSSGQTAYVKLRFDKAEPGLGVTTIDDITYFDENGEPMGGLKMANGTNSQRDDEGSFPGTRGRSAFLVREQFIKAREYQRKLHAAVNDDGSVDESKLPDRDLHLETLAEVMRGERTVHHHTHRHDDIMTVLRLAEEFGFRVVLHHVSDGFLVADEIAERGVEVSAILVDSPGGKHEAVGVRWETPGILEAAGVRTVVHTDDWITDSRIFRRMAGFAVRGGMSREKALEAVTIAGAEMLDIDHRAGSLTPGKDADVIVLSGDPLSVYSVVERTYVEGQLAFDRGDEDDRLYALGGYGAGDDSEPYFCCYDAEMKGLLKSGRIGGVQMRGNN